MSSRSTCCRYCSVRKDRLFVKTLTCPGVRDQPPHPDHHPDVHGVQQHAVLQLPTTIRRDGTEDDDMNWKVRQQLTLVGSSIVIVSILLLYCC